MQVTNGRIVRATISLVFAMTDPVVFKFQIRYQNFAIFETKNNLANRRYRRNGYSREFRGGRLTPWLHCVRLIIELAFICPCFDPNSGEQIKNTLNARRGA
jgi:Fic family protein